MRFPNIYGIDMPAAEELVALNRTEQEIQEFLGVGCWSTRTSKTWRPRCAKSNPAVKEFDSSCFSGRYTTDIEPGYFERI